MLLVGKMHHRKKLSLDHLADSDRFAIRSRSTRSGSNGATLIILLAWILGAPYRSTDRGYYLPEGPTDLEIKIRNEEALKLNADWQAIQKARAGNMPDHKKPLY